MRGPNTAICYVHSCALFWLRRLQRYIMQNVPRYMESIVRVFQKGALTTYLLKISTL